MDGVELVFLGVGCRGESEQQQDRYGEADADRKGICAQIAAGIADRIAAKARAHRGFRRSGF